MNSLKELKNFYNNNGQKIIAMTREAWKGKKIIYNVSHSDIISNALRNEAKEIFEDYFNYNLKKVHIFERYDLMSEDETKPNKINIECNYSLSEEDLNAKDWYVLKSIKKENY